MARLVDPARLGPSCVLPICAPIFFAKDFEIAAVGPFESFSAEAQYSGPVNTKTGQASICKRAHFTETAGRRDLSAGKCSGLSRRLVTIQVQE